MGNKVKLSQSIKLETAKLAKEMGFYVDGMTYESERIGFLKWISYQMPIQSVLQSWLRDQGVHLYIIDDILAGQTQDYGDSYYVIKTNKDRVTSDAFMTYEDALEEGLIHGLKILKSWKMSY
jgi:hypothetical protein